MEPITLFYTIVSANLYRGIRSDFFDLVFNAGLVVKLVLLILLFSSIVSWAIIFLKFKIIRKADAETKDFLQIFGSKEDLSSIYLQSRRFRCSPVAEIFRAGYLEFKQPPKNRAITIENQDSSQLIQMGKNNNINRAIKQANTNQINRLERNLSFLATTGNAAPFIGLFGTVWGIMKAFQEIGQKGATSIAIVAPGISEALIATAAGLFAAIPAVIAYNYYLSRIKRIVSEMDSFSDDFLNSIRS